MIYEIFFSTFKKFQKRQLARTKRRIVKEGKGQQLTFYALRLSFWKIYDPKTDGFMRGLVKAISERKSGELRQVNLKTGLSVNEVIYNS